MIHKFPMAELSGTHTQILHSQSQSPSSSASGNEDGDVKELVGYREFQETMPLEDTVVLDSPFADTPMENLGFDTEPEGDVDCVVENLSAAAVSGYREEVVLDSEDEVVHGSKGANGLVDGKAGRRFTGNVLDFEKGQLGSPQKQLDDVVADSDDSAYEKRNEVSSIDFRSSGRVGSPSHSPDCNQNLRLNYVGSQEPGESSQANALDIVDHFLSLNNVDSSPGVNHRAVIRAKSSSVSSAKGRQSLAKRLPLKTPIVKAGTFEWTDSDQHNGSEFFHNRKESSFDFGGYRHQEDRNLHREGGSSLVHKHEENNEVSDLHKEMVSTYSNSRSALCSSREVSREVQVIGNITIKEVDDQFDPRLTGQQLEAGDVGGDTSNMFDIGFSTQVAAEAMEALACGPPAGFNYGDAFQGPENTLDHSPRGLIRNETHLGCSSFPQSAWSDRADIGKHSKQRKRSAKRLNRGSSDKFQIQSENKELDPKLAITTKVKVGKSSVERQLSCGNSTEANESLGRRSGKSSKQRNAKRSSGGTKLRELEVDRGTSFLGEPILFGKGQPQGKCMKLSHVAHRIRQQMSEDTLVRTKGQLDNAGETIRGGKIIQYRRKRSRLAAHPVEVLRNKDESDNPGESIKDSSVIQYKRKRRCLAADPVKALWTRDKSDNPGERTNNGSIIQYRRKKSRLDADPVEVLRTKDQSDNPGERRYDSSIVQYRIKSHLAADPVDVLSVREKCSKLDYNLCRDAGHCKLNQRDQSVQEVTGIASYLRSNPWRHPRGKRTSRNVRSYSNRPNSIYTPLLTIYGKESNIHSCKSQKRPEDNDKVKGKAGSSICTYPHWRSSENDSDRSLSGKKFDKLGSRGAMSNCESAVIDATMFPAGFCRARTLMQPGNLNGKDSMSFADDGEKTHKLEVLSNKSIETSGSESTVTFSSIKGISEAAANCMFYDYHRKPCNKNLPKSSLLKEIMIIGVRESRPDLAWKDLRKRRDMAHVQVLFSQHLDNNIIKQQKKILARLGMSVASCSRDATHFIADKFARTRNMLEAIALGKPVVTHLWLENCGQASCLIDEKNFILRDYKKEKEIGFSMPVSLARASQHPLLKQGQRVLITPSIKPDREMITGLVKAVHGQLVERSQISAGNDDLDDLLILSCEEDHAICRPFLMRGAAIYCSELVLNGIVVQKLEYERHKLFTNQVKRKQSST
ncbi:hypothetical protein I3842_08G101100 [Carya illinoinensis]|uniref:BRCT domain-containing protein n=1 Tax=Carya illinoinensis TaxID=32201 RepID=A0A922JD77_CARIL|nr:hypothetical protein I3842_08G101100 [Carya illinoinensis]